MNTTSQSTEHIRRHRTGRRPHRRLSARHMDRVNRKFKGKLNLTADQERDFDALVKSFSELRAAHTDKWLKDEAVTTFEATESALAESLEKVDEIHRQAEDFRRTLSEEQQVVYDKLQTHRSHRTRRHKRI